MSKTTTNLNLFKYDTIQDAKLPFSIDEALNNNWDKIDVVGGTVSDLSFLVSTHNKDITSLKDSVKSILTATVNKAASGYIKFSNGIIIQWVNSAKASSDGIATKSWPITFSNTNYSITRSHNANSSSNEGSKDREQCIYKKSTSQFSYYALTDWAEFFIAIGY